MFSTRSFTIIFSYYKKHRAGVIDLNKLELRSKGWKTQQSENRQKHLKILISVQNYPLESAKINKIWLGIFIVDHLVILTISLYWTNLFNQSIFNPIPIAASFL